MKKKKILDIDTKKIWHPFTQSNNEDKPIIIDYAKDEKIYDIDGKAYVDLISSWWVNIHGHAKKEIAHAIFKQSKKLEQVVFAGFSHEPAVILADRLTKLLPRKLSRVFYSDNGSTAVEIALKVATQYWYNKNKKKNKFVAFEGGYHGDTIGAMSVGYSSGFYEPFKDLVFKSDFIPFSQDWRGNNNIFDEEEKALKKIDILLHKNSENIAAVILEPLIQGASGMKMCRPQYLDNVVKKFQSKGILVIFDEVLTGFGRTGKMFALDHLENKPDIVCLAKSLTAGYLPLGATVFSEYIHQAFVDISIKKAFLHGHSFSANPIACSAALESLDLFEKENTFKRIKKIESINSEGLNFLKSNKRVTKVRFMGGISAFDIVGFDKGYGADIGNTLKKIFLKKGFLLRPLGETVYLMPPYCIPEKTLENIYYFIDEELKKI
tara:strand:- start:303 stop:1610 length:1308 start_codon:yes stop_codon:yes gene_type:complete